LRREVFPRVRLLASPSRETEEIVMNQTSTLHRLAERDARALDRMDDRQLADIGLERQGGLIIDTGGRAVRRVAVDVGFERALRVTLSAMRGAFARRTA
jgi:uncharacterized protein YjiS (DUF1127 family)